MALPTTYLYDIADEPPRVLRAASCAESGAWLSNRVHARETPAEGAELLLARVTEVDTIDGVWSVPPELRVAAYDAMTVAEREVWDRSFRAIAREWLDAAAARFAGADELPQASGWDDQVAAYDTIDGGLLLICGAPDDGGPGVGSWFESTRFVLCEVADAAGFCILTTFDIR